MVKIHEGQVSIEQAKAYWKLFPDMAIRSTFINEDGNKMPIDYDTLDEALSHKERHGSIWLHLPDGSQRQIAPRSEEEYQKILAS